MNNLCSILPHFTLFLDWKPLPILLWKVVMLQTLSFLLFLLRQTFCSFTWSCSIELLASPHVMREEVLRHVLPGLTFHILHFMCNQASRNTKKSYPWTYLEHFPMSECSREAICWKTTLVKGCTLPHIFRKVSLKVAKIFPVFFFGAFFIFFLFCFLDVAPSLLTYHSLC